MNTLESDVLNPYAAPQVGPDAIDPFQQDDIRIRQQFIDCESNVCSIAWALTFGGLILAGAFGIPAFIMLADGGTRALGGSLFLALLTLLSLAQMIVGIRVRSLRPRARIGAIIFCGLWLLFFPVGTILGGACLWYLIRPAAQYVFTPEYREVIRNTPHVRFQTSAVSWIMLVTMLLGFLALVVLSEL